MKNLVELHGGSVEVQSDGLGQGSEFIVRLPLLAGIGEREPAPAAPSEAAASRRVLIVDDNRDSANTLALVLQTAGHEVVVAYDGEQALERAAAFRPQFVLLDLGLPKVNGYDAARRIRSEPWGRDCVLIAVTGWGQDDDRRRTRDAGFDEHLVKPVDFETLTRLLAEPGERAPSSAAS